MTLSFLILASFCHLLVALETRSYLNLCSIFQELSSLSSFGLNSLIILSILIKAFSFSSSWSTWGPIDSLPKWLYCNGLIALQWSHQMLQFTAKVSPIHHPEPTALNHRKKLLISGQWAGSRHFWTLLFAGGKWLILLALRVLWV